MKTIAYIRTSSIYNDSRATKEINALLESGYKVIVFGWDRDGKGHDNCSKLFGNKNVELFFYDVQIVTLGGLKGIFKLLGFATWVFQLLHKQKHKVAIYHICDMDAGAGAVTFCWIYKKPYVYDIYDYYIDTHPVPFVLKAIAECLEIRMINEALTTIICTEERREQIKTAHPNKVTIIHNAPEINNLLEYNILQDVSYCGVFGPQRLIAEIVSEYMFNSDIKFVFAGGGLYEENVSKISGEYENFRYLGPVPYNEVLKISAQSKILFAIYEPTIRNHRLCAPNKFYEALALGKPVIVCRGTGIDRIVEKYNLGIVIDYDAKQFFKAVRYLLTHPNECEEMGKRGRELFLEKYDWRIMKKRLLGVYEGIFASGVKC